MPTKKHPQTAEEQARKFRREAEKLIAAGELDPKKGSDLLSNLIENERKVGKA